MIMQSLLPASVEITPARTASKFEIYRLRESFDVAYFQFYNTAFFRGPLAA